MTNQYEISNNKNYISILNEGFVGLIDHMGSDDSIVQAARVSYGKGTKKVNEDRGLIRYLLRHKHTTPFEMVTLKFHIKMPIFVARQFIRHRTASVNEYSGRYSVMVDEFYVPELENILPQSTTNKQGRGGSMNEHDQIQVRNTIIEANRDCYTVYQKLLNNINDSSFSDEFKGLSREMARGVLNVNNYTELYWSINLHNLFHFLKLRLDDHAQWEIQQVAKALYSLTKKVVPIASEAFEDYIQFSEQMSKMEIELLKFMVGGRSWNLVKANYGGEEGIIKHFKLTKRELIDFKKKLNID